MSGRSRKGRSKHGGQFVPISYVMAVSPAWRALSGNAIKVYIELRRRYNGGNNGDLSLSLDEGARLLSIGKATVARALRELEEKGFTRLTQRGHWYGRKASTFAVTDRPVGTHPAGNRWRIWHNPAAKAHSDRVRATNSRDDIAIEPTSGK
jgi:hypothetical protein